MKAKASATATDAQIPSRPKTKGKVNITAIWNKSVREKDISADTGPLFKAVKKAEP